ncbi:hypothetical protein ES319_D09G077600v1 [Gossypium barbadense]|uniref:Uncharacterized protein n=1 Tax=Gossypium barbadense TaxID=3634 RepID=A0A5J5Q0D8_GOSBA|nr:hypothetical protein ES319_D09G077600v1 [Gossypium barbadense]
MGITPCYWGKCFFKTNALYLSVSLRNKFGFIPCDVSLIICLIFENPFGVNNVATRWSRNQFPYFISFLLMQHFLHDLNNFNKYIHGGMP